MTNKRIRAVSLVLAILALAGCSSSYQATLPAPEMPLVQEHSTNEQKTTNMGLSLSDTLILDEAISRTLASNPELQVLKSEIKASEAHALQQSLLPNPELVIELENFAGSGPLSGFKNTETTIAIGQLIELGGKRAKRTKIAARQSDLTLLRYEIKRLEIITKVRSIFTQVLAAQMKLNLDHQLLGIAERFKATIDTLVHAGRFSVAEASRAQVELSNRKLARQQSIRELNNSKRLLVSTWGSNTVNFTRVAGDLFTIRALPEPEWLLGALENSPRIIEQNAVITSRKAETELARAQAIPDPVLIAGYRRFNQTDNEAFVAGLSVPLPIFDRNQGGKKEALFRELQSEQQMQNLRNLLSAELNIRMENLQNFSTEIQTMRNVIIPEAQKAYDIIYKNYRLGNYAIIDVLDAQRQLFDAEGRYIDNLARINLEIIELEGILGQSLKSF